jgi:hypothetical protein
MESSEHGPKVAFTTAKAQTATLMFGRQHAPPFGEGRGARSCAICAVTASDGTGG